MFLIEIVLLPFNGVQVHLISWALCHCASLLPAVEELCIELSRAIETGDTHAAVRYASDLARQQIALTIQPALRDAEDREIRCVFALVTLQL